jgi:hypothetical protein
MSDQPDIIHELAKRIAVVVDENLSAFIRKIDGRFPAREEIAEHGRFVQIDQQSNVRFFVWRKHNVLSIRYGTTDEPAAVVFCHLYPDDWPEPLANFISELP